jgi:biopolymer transport protein ExbD
MGSRDSLHVDPRNVRRVEVNARGEYWLEGHRLTLPQLAGELLNAHRQNPKLIVYIASDRRAAWEYGVAVINACLGNGITQFSVKTSPGQIP